MFAEEQPMLVPLPAEPFHYYEYGERTVHLDGCLLSLGAARVGLSKSAARGMISTAGGGAVVATGVAGGAAGAGCAGGAPAAVGGGAEV